MKLRVKFLTALAISAISICGYAQNVTDPHAALVQQSVNSFMQKNKVPGVAVELFVGGKPYAYYYGYADKDQKTPVTGKTIFELGSITKVMTSILLAQEVDWAKMAFTDPVNKYIKDLPADFRKVKLQDLAAHTSGLPFSVPRNVTTQDELKAYLMKWSPEADPGDQWGYSNLGVGLLGLALENSTEMDYDKLYRRHILNPLKMVVGVNISPAMMKYYAQGYDKDGNPAPRVEPGLLPGAVSIKATGDDMQHFLSAAIGLPGTPPRLFYPIRMTQSSYVKLPGENQGLGWQIHPIAYGDAGYLMRISDVKDYGPIDVQEIYARPMYSGDALFDKSGTTAGFRAYIAVLPNKNAGIVFLANKNVSNSAIIGTARQLLFKLTGLV